MDFKIRYRSTNYTLISTKSMFTSINYWVSSPKTFLWGELRFQGKIGTFSIPRKRFENLLLVRALQPTNLKAFQPSNLQAFQPSMAFQCLSWNLFFQKIPIGMEKMKIL